MGSAIRVDARTAEASDDEGVARLAKAVGHPARVAILRALLARGTCIGCDLADQVGLAASTTSEHLRILKAAGLITGRIDHPRVCYALAPDAVTPLRDFVAALTTPVAARGSRETSA